MGIERCLPASVKGLALVVALGIGAGCENFISPSSSRPNTPFASEQGSPSKRWGKSYGEEAPDIYRQERKRIIALYADTDNDHYLSQDEVDELLMDVAGKCDLLYVAGTDISTQEGFLVATGNLVKFDGISFASGDPGEEPSYIHLANCFTTYAEMRERQAAGEQSKNQQQELPSALEFQTGSGSQPH